MSPRSEGWGWGVARARGVSPYGRHQALTPGPRPEHPYAITCTRLRPHVAGVGHFSLSILTRGTAGGTGPGGKSRAPGGGGGAEGGKRRGGNSSSASPDRARRRHASLGQPCTTSRGEKRVKSSEAPASRGVGKARVGSPTAKPRGQQGRCESGKGKGKGRGKVNSAAATSTTLTGTTPTGTTPTRRLVRWGEEPVLEKRKPIRRTPTGLTLRVD